MPSVETSDAEAAMKRPAHALRVVLRHALPVAVALWPLAASAAQPDLTKSMTPQPAVSAPAPARPAMTEPASSPAAAPSSAATKKPTADWPKILPKAGTPPPITEWSEAEIAAERARCTALLNGSDVVAIPAAPIRENECGAAAPVELVSVGRNPQVTFSPPAVTTCDMALALSRWMKEIQPVSRKHLGADIARVEVMSSYSCRNAYGRKSTRLSEHGKANAIDIKGFVTVAGIASNVLDDWGPTGRDIRAQVAAAKAAAKKAEAERATAATIRGTQPVPGAPAAVATTQSGPQGTGSATIATGTTSSQPVAQGFAPSGVSVGTRETPGIRIGSERPDEAGGGRSIGLSTSPLPGALGRLGGPHPVIKGPGPTLAAAPRTEPAGTPDKRMQFHRALHEIACKMFGTVLGPEANEAHRNHFHLDLAERKLSNFCE